MINKTFRLFVSSTFSDFLVERQILSDKVQKAISDFCQEKGYFFQLIDLRWGVNSESALMQNTLSICLEEVRRCKKLSPRPNFLLMVGERYGWIPLPQKILKNDFDAIISVSTTEEAALLQRWYQLDENESCSAYFLCARSGKYKIDSQWFDVENQLRPILVNNASKIGVSSNKIRELTTSATEWEIIEGLLGNPGIGDNVLAVFRTGYKEKERDQDLSSILKLRQKIKERMQHDGISENLIELNYSSNYAAQFEETICEKLKRSIEQEICRIESLKTANDNQHILQSILSESGAAYCKRLNLLRKIQNYVDGMEDSPLFITGEPGSGKSSILADYLVHSHYQSFYVFFGHGEHSYRIYSAISFLCASVKVHYKCSNISEHIFGGTGRAFMDAINSIPNGEKVLFVIDGLDAFYDLDEVKENLFPSRLPNNIKMIISSASKSVTDRFRCAWTPTLAIEQFTPNESRKILSDYLSSKGRRVTNAEQNTCIDRALEHGATPLQIKLLAALCSQWKSSDSGVYLPETAEKAALLYIHTMFANYGHNKSLVLYALALVAVSPAGITEHMLADILLKFKPVKKYFIKEDRYQHSLDKLPFVVWSRLLYDMQDGLDLAISLGGTVVRFRHNIFRSVMHRMYSKYCDKARKELVTYYANQPHCISDVCPNFLKLQTYPAILKESGQNDILYSLFTDLSYVDAAIKAGFMDGVIEELMVMTRGISLASEDTAHSILECIQRCQERLICNKADFLNCASDSGLISGKPPALSCIGNTRTGRLYFPHSSQCKLVWADNKSQYAVLCGPELWLCNASPYMEQGHISLSADIQGNEMKIHDVLWLEHNLIAVLTENGEALVYSYMNMTPHLYDRFSFDATSSDAVYIPSLKGIVYAFEGNVYIRNVINKETLYQIPVLSKRGAAFGVYSKNNELVLLQNFSQIEEYDLSTGKKKYSHKIKLSKRAALRLSAGSGHKFCINKLSTKRWLLYCQDDLWYVVVNENDITYLQVPSIPNFEKVSPDLSGNAFHIITWDKGLFLLDLNNSYRLRFYSCHNISNVSWIEKDKRISVLTDQGLCAVDLEEFDAFGSDDVSCFCSDLDLQHTVLFVGDGMNRNTSLITFVSKVLHALLLSKDEAYFHYDIFFKLSGNYEPQADRATMVVFSSDGKKAVAYEGKNSIVVFDGQEQPQIVIDKLRLAINDNILNLSFSPSGRYLLIWRNHSIVVIDSNDGAYVLQLNIALRPALAVSFEDDGCLRVVLCDWNTYNFIHKNDSSAFVCNDHFPDKLVSSADTDAYAGPYTVYPYNDGGKTVPLFLPDSFDDVPRLKLNDTRIYRGVKHWLLFMNGEFYLDGNIEQAFSHPYCDFVECLNRETRKDQSPLMGYLRSKNDIMNVLFEPDDRHLILISRSLNAVLLFNIHESVLSAIYKVSGNIIGVQKAENDSIELVCDEQPTHICIALNLP